MAKYKLLAFIYLFSVVSSSAANSLGLDVQILYRVPFLNIRWIDVAILTVLVTYLNDIFFLNEKTWNKHYVIFFLIFLIFEAFQLIRSWLPSDPGRQISWFLCTLSFFILIDLFTYRIPTDTIIKFLKQFALWGSVALIISNAYLFYSFITGTSVLTDGDIRVALEVVGKKIN